MVYEFLNRLLSDKNGGEVFTCFGRFHSLFILLTFIAITTLILLTKRRKCKENVAKYIINIAFGLYIFGFFMMPIVNIVLFFSVEALIYSMLSIVREYAKK